MTSAEDTALPLYTATLRGSGIEPDAAGLRKYLRQLHPDEQQRRAARQLIEQLGAEGFADRESAMKELIAMPVPPTEATRKAAESRDAEIRWRAKIILATQKPRRTVVMHAVFKTIELKKVPGLTNELLRAVGLCDQRHLRAAVLAAVQASSGPNDMPLLRRAAVGDDKEVVVVAIGGLSGIGTDARDDLRGLLEHKTEEIRLAAARALADQGDRVSLDPLVKLLKSESLEVRLGSVQTLRQASGERHKYVAYEDEATRKKAVKRWSEWVRDEGPTAKLRFPLKSIRVELGRTLITVYTRNKVIELDASGKQIWEKTGLKQPWASVGLPNGHRLISNYTGRSVIEYDTGGKEVWRKDKLPASPFNVRRLGNGNTLIACSDSQKVIEIRPDGSTAWEITIAGRPMDVRRLENGRTLVTLQNGHRVVEVDHEGKIQWELKGVVSPITAQRLEDGTTLVAEVGAGRVAQWDRAGKVVWEHKSLKNPYSAERLSNGNTLIVHANDVREVNQQGETVWEKKMTGLAHATRY